MRVGGAVKQAERNLVGVELRDTHERRLGQQPVVGRVRPRLLFRRVVDRLLRLDLQVNVVKVAVPFQLANRTPLATALLEPGRVRIRVRVELVAGRPEHGAPEVDFQVVEGSIVIVFE